VPSRKNQRPFGVLKTDGKVKCRSGIHPNKRLLDQQRIRLIAAARRVASRWLTAVLLAVIWTSALGGSLHARQSQGDLVGTRHAPARNVNFGTAGDYGPGMVQESSQLPRLSQAVTGDQLQKASSREHYRPELPAPPQGAAIEVQKSLRQERERAERLEQALSPAKRLEKPTLASNEKQASQGSAADLQNTLQQFREWADRLEQALAPAKREIETQTAITGKKIDEATHLKQSAESGVELQKSLQQERERAERLRQDIATAKRELDTQIAMAAKANDEMIRLKQAAESGAELRMSLQQERELAAQLREDLATAKREFETQTALATKANDEVIRLKQAAESGVELQKSLQQERERATQLREDLATANRELETQTALANKANEEATRLKRVAETGAKLENFRRQGQERTSQLQQNLAAAKREVETQTALVAKANEEANRVATETGAKLENSRRKAQEQVTQLQQELAAAKREVETQTAVAAKANEEATRLKQAAESATVELKSVQQERGRAAQLQQDFAMVKREIERKDALVRDLSLVRTRSYACQEPSEAVLSTKPLAEADGFRKSLQWRRNPAKQLERALILAEHGKDSPPWIATVAVSQMARNELLEAPPLTVANARASLQPDPADAVEAAKLRARAGVLLGQGDIGAARVVLERAAEKGSAQAMFELAETYDPLILPRWRTYGTRGDATKARDLYAKAETDGIKEAKQRSDALRLVDR
jgi:hypothetical protein